jgi:succinylarginine dihydrolase
VRRAAAGLFEPEFVMVSEEELPLASAVRSYLFNSMLVRPPGEDRLVFVAPAEVRADPRSRATAERLAGSNGPIGRVEYVDVRQSMKNGGGPACLRLRLSLNEGELAAANAAQRFGPDLHARLADWVERRYRDRLLPEDLADPALAQEGRAALDELTGLLGLGSDFYPFQRA